MKKIEYFWNRLYYGIFCCHKDTQIIIHKITTFLFGLFITNDNRKRVYREHQNSVIRSLTDKRFSTTLIISDIEMIALTALFFWGTANCLTRIFPCLFLGSLNELIFIIISAIPCLCLNYYLLWRKDKYLKYFESFEQYSKMNKEWMLISVICCISILAFFIMSFYIIES